MKISESRVETPNAGRYLAQLCKHFAHKLPVELHDTVGSIVFTIGICRLEAQPAALLLRCESPDATKLDQLQTVITEHVARFGWREAPEIIWATAD
ncbi:MAG: DUF2218 domain-containing protein [Alphaproteobacteria bacterium]|nr:DUF2218 domain-containing protein [Alphaproteobacteria bacterium]MBU0796988.1 DUF2218 domain-containing protein [Alphaproteobacteria bacterium]MBU0886797.1 DUF2218 domain-containing protein [Alphaproteobacteria bacterium]MBU1812461.1 DUF2218 domain-containing protein [Alphaproteobacteria bacterium]